MPGHILALDQGTSSSRAIVFDAGGGVVAAAQREFGQHFPQPGWVEHEPEEIWDTQLTVAREADGKAVPARGADQGHLADGHREQTLGRAARVAHEDLPRRLAHVPREREERHVPRERDLAVLAAFCVGCSDLFGHFEGEQHEACPRVGATDEPRALRLRSAG